VAAALKINIGSNDRDLPGFINVDCDEHGKNVDLKCDVSDMSFLPSSCADEIYASHILEHFPYSQAQAVLDGWTRLLMPGGILYIAVPDFGSCVDLYKKTGLSEWMVRFLYGDQEYKTAFHYNAFDRNRLGAMLKKSGYSDVSQVDQFRFLRNDCSSLVSNFDRTPVSLNMVAIK
jgi:ubiquinone/menaquinone biosynthesis C-methylase UbiE